MQDTLSKLNEEKSWLSELPPSRPNNVAKAWLEWIFGCRVGRLWLVRREEVNCRASRLTSRANLALAVLDGAAINCVNPFFMEESTILAFVGNALTNGNAWTMMKKQLRKRSCGTFNFFQLLQRSDKRWLTKGSFWKQKKSLIIICFKITFPRVQSQVLFHFIFFNDALRLQFSECLLSTWVPQRLVNARRLSL